MESLIFIKLGGSVITDKNTPFTSKNTAIRKLGREILKVQEKFKGKVIVAHGSGSFGHTVAAKYQTHKGIINKKSIEGFVKTSDAATEINKIVMKNLIDVGLKVKSFSPASFIVAKNQKAQKVFADPIRQCLLTGSVPVIYGDVVMDADIGFCIFSAEKVIEALVKALNKSYKVEKIIYCTDTDGVYNEHGKTIPLITPKNYRFVKKQITGSKSMDVTGGMIHKVEESLKLAKRFKVKVHLINGFLDNNIYNLISKKKINETIILRNQK